MDADEKYEILQHGGTSIVEKRVCFDRANKYLFCCVGNVVKVYSVETTECVNKLIHDSNLVSVFLYPHNFLQILTCTEDGEICLWDYEDAVKVKSFQLNQRVSAFFICLENPFLGFVVALNDEKLWCLNEVKRSSNGIESNEIVKSVPVCSKKISVHSRGHFVVVVRGDLMTIVKTHDESKEIIHRLKGMNRNCFTCVQCHPSKECLATGDNFGRIILWYNFLKKQPAQSIFHWHSSEVVDIVFPTHGSSMYSGGRESVVVKWSLESSSKQETKEFLPRLNGQIKNLSTSSDNSIIAVSLDDNSVVLASGRLEVMKSLQGFVRSAWRQPCIDGSAGYQYDLLPLGLRYDSVLLSQMTGRGCLITNGTPGRVQFYDVKDEKQIFSLDVVGRNLPPIENHKILPYSEVIHMATNKNWMSTIDYRPDDSYTIDFCLKFWLYNDLSSTFDLVTSVEHPHLRIVTSMEFSPSDSNSVSLVTTSLDGTFKVWILEELDEISEKKLIWICDRFGEYRDLPAHCCAFTRVGSVLAVGFDQCITFWNFDENRLLFQLTVAEKPNFARNIKFGVVSDELSLLCVLSSTNLTVWDVDSQVLLWAFDTQVTSMCIDPMSGQLAAFGSKRMFIFQLSDPKPILSIDHDDREVYSACFYPCVDEIKQKSSSNLFYMTSDQKLMRVCPEWQAELYRSKKLAKKPADSKITRLANFLTESRFNKDENHLKDDRLIDQKSNLELLNAPAHTLPSLDVLAPHFIESCLQPKRKFKMKIEPIDYYERKFARCKSPETNLSTVFETKTSKKFVKCDFSELASYFSTL